MDEIDPRLSAINTSLYRVAVRAVILKDGKLLMVKEFDDDYWSVPGGGVDYGEKPLDALARELREETGIKPGEYEVDENPLLISQAINETLPRFNLYYKVTLTTGEIKKTEDKDIEFFEWYVADKVVDAYVKAMAYDARYIVENVMS